MDEASSDISEGHVAADTIVLLKSVEGLLDIVQTEASVYRDARRRLVDARVKRASLSIAAGDAFYVEPTRSGPDLGLMRRKLGRLGTRLRQLGGEREAANVETDAAFKQLTDENEHLREELTQLRAKFLISGAAENCSFS
jgi:hypothetical protein